MRKKPSLTLADISRQINQVNDGVIELAQEVRSEIADLRGPLSDIRGQLTLIDTRLTRIEEQILADHSRRIATLEALVLERR